VIDLPRTHLLHGRMVDKPVVEHARRIVARATY
jgi:citrate lyase beta subunit